MNYTLQKQMGITSSVINLEKSVQVGQSYGRNEYDKVGYKAKEKTREVTCCSPMKYQDVI
jgi:hypothetical protein